LLSKYENYLINVCYYYYPSKTINHYYQLTGLFICKYIYAYNIYFKERSSICTWRSDVNKLIDLKQLFISHFCTVVNGKNNKKKKKKYYNI